MPSPDGERTCDVSVVVPLYNQRDRIADTLRSVLEQTVLPAEIIVVDDGSTDGSSDSVRALIGKAKGGRRVRLVRQPNRGPGAARNLGLREACSRRVAFLDADDLWKRDKLAEQTAFLDSRPDVAWCACNYERVCRGGARATALPPLSARWTVFEDWFDANLARDRTLTSGVVVETALLREVDGFDAEVPHGQDTDLWIRLALTGRAYAWCSTPLFDYLDLEGSVSKPSRERYIDGARLLERHAAAAARGPLTYDRYVRRKLGALLKATVSHGHPDLTRRVLRGMPARYWRSRLASYAGAAVLPAGVQRRLAVAVRTARHR